MRKPSARGVLICGDGFIGKEFNTEITKDPERAEKAKNGKRKEVTEKSTLFVAEPAIEDWLIGVDAAVTEKRPVAASFFALGGIAFDDQDFFLVVGGFGDDLAKRIGNKRISPEFQSGVAFLRFAFVSNAIDYRGIDAVGDGVAALNGFPGVKLRGAELRFLVRMPGNAGGIENHVRAAERGEARAFRVPLVPADLDGDARVLGIEIRKAEVAGSEVKLFVIERIVGDMHFAVFAEERTVGIKDGAGIVIDAGGAALE